jgi:hypothetical protein
VRLFHFSDDPAIERFEPRPVRVASARPPGQAWLNGPLVWAIDDWHAPMYLFPRDCPRILLWPLPASTPEDLERWWAGRTCRMAAFVEQRWLDRLHGARLWRYELPADRFESLEDAGMWVSGEAAIPVAVTVIEDLPGALAASDVELNVLPDLLPLREAWSSTLHASGIRLRNAVDWKS